MNGLTNPSAARFGVTSELAAGNDYRLFAQWAEAAHVAGFDAIWYLPRFTPGQEYAAGVFGNEGPAPELSVVETVAVAHQILRLGYVVPTRRGHRCSMMGTDLTLIRDERR